MTSRSLRDRPGTTETADTFRRRISGSRDHNVGVTAFLRWMDDLVRRALPDDDRSGQSPTRLDVDLVFRRRRRNTETEVVVDAYGEALWKRLGR